MKKSRTELNTLSHSILDSSYKIHTTYGPGLLESAYEALLTYELQKKGLMVNRQIAIPIIHEGVELDTAYRLDILVENAVIVELKSIEAILDVHHKQLITYLKFSDKRLGLLINFNVVSLKNGIHRKVNNF